MISGGRRRSHDARRLTLRTPAGRPIDLTADRAETLGLSVSELTAAQKRELKLQGGVRIDSATDAAARAGLREGDLILSVNNVEVTGVKQFLAQLAKADKAKAVNLMVRREDVVSFVLLRPNR